nr:MAG TPA: hypothetical protein [Bacteriophage sp.]
MTIYPIFMISYNLTKLYNIIEMWYTISVVRVVIKRRK